MNEQQEFLGTGLIPDLPDERDYSYEKTFGASPIDWDQGFILPEPPDASQGNSDSCVAYSASYLHWQHKRKDYSRRDLFSRIALPYGAYLRDGVKQLCTTGQQDQKECPDPAQPNPANMRVKSDLPDSAGMDDLEASYFGMSVNMDIVAQAIRDHGGCILGVNGDWTNWSDLTNPKPPTKPEWAHALYVFGYQKRDGQRCIIAKSSWCRPGHNKHYIKEDYFTSGNVFSPWAIVPKKLMTKRYVLNDNGKIGLLMLEGFTGTVTFAKDEPSLQKLKEAMEYNGTEKTVTLPQ